jgi:hypothetical protein
VYLLALKGILTSPSYYLETTLLFAISTWITFKKLIAIESPGTFTQAYLGSIVLQLLVWVGYLGVVLYLDRSGANANAVYFLINCLVFIALEVSFLFLRKQP